MTSRRVAVVALLSMVSASVLAEWARPTIREMDEHTGVKLEDLFPSKFADWKIDDTLPVVLPSPDQQAQLDKIYNQTLARTFVNSKGERIMLSVAYGGDQSDGLTVHMPEVCYVSQGFRLEWTRVGSVPLTGEHAIPVREVLTTMGRRIEPITYWILTGDQATISTTERRIVSLRYGLRRRIPEGMLVRVSSIDPDVERALKIQRGFINDMVAAVRPDQRERVIGKVFIPASSKS